MRHAPFISEVVIGQEFTSSGTWNHPFPGFPIEVFAWCIGGGGGGGGGWGGSGWGGSGGGGGGAISYTRQIATEDVNITIGTGGTRGAANSNGSAGGGTSFGSYITANGGSGGLSSNGGAGAGGTSSILTNTFFNASFAGAAGGQRAVKGADINNRNLYTGYKFTGVGGTASGVTTWNGGGGGAGYNGNGGVGGDFYASTLPTDADANSGAGGGGGYFTPATVGAYGGSGYCYVLCCIPSFLFRKIKTDNKNNAIKIITQDFTSAGTWYRPTFSPYTRIFIKAIAGGSAGTSTLGGGGGSIINKMVFVNTNLDIVIGVGGSGSSGAPGGATTIGNVANTNGGAGYGIGGTVPSDDNLLNNGFIYYYPKAGVNGGSSSVSALKSEMIDYFGFFTYSPTGATYNGGTGYNGDGADNNTAATDNSGAGAGRYSSTVKAGGSGFASITYIL